jgi:hypothetical protein
MVEWRYRCSSFTPRLLYPTENSCALWTEGWMGPRADLDAVEKRQLLLLLEIEPRPSSP